MSPAAPPPLPSPFEILATSNTAGRPDGQTRLHVTPISYIASGGWSHVYLVRVRSGGVEAEVQDDTVDGGDDVLSVWKRAAQPVKYMHRELELHKDLKHENIVQIIHHWLEISDHPEIDRHLNLLLTPNAHQPLSTLSTPSQPLPEPQALSIIKQLTSALIYLHTEPRCIAHRDLKAENILFDPVEEIKDQEERNRFPWGKVYICDFGCANRIKKGELSHTAVSEQKIRSPEMLKASPAKALLRTNIDIFALGLLFIRLLLGEDLLRYRSTVEKQLEELTTILGADPDEEELAERLNMVFAKENVSISDVMLDLAVKMLAFDPAVRPSAVQLGELLETVQLE